MCDAGDGACSNLREKDSFRFRLYVWMGLLVMTCFCLFGHHFVCYFSFVGLTHIDWVFCISLAFGLIMNGLWTLDFGLLDFVEFLYGANFGDAISFPLDSRGRKCFVCGDL
jgi:hypothetical protein